MSDFQYTQPELAKINDNVEDAVGIHLQIASLKTQLKDKAAHVKDEFGLPTSEFNALVGERFDEKTTKTQEKAEKILELNEELELAAKNRDSGHLEHAETV